MKMVNSVFPEHDELPKYESHKIVRAGRIVSAIGGVLSVQLGQNTKAIVDIDVGRAWQKKFLAEAPTPIDGYFVQYEDGYCSYSPREAFESGYTILDDVREFFVGDADLPPDEFPRIPPADHLTVHQRYVVDEYNELLARYIKWRNYSHAAAYNKESDTEKGLIKKQLEAMAKYLDVLQLRIEQF